ncbi:MAG: amidohydrolase [Fusobacteriaceae bacterium]|nr:amidohydrolase [Fusobacteriaceae bacterium]
MENTKKIIKIKNLRKLLHENAELSSMEKNTIKILINFLRENTSLEIVEKIGYFYAIHREKDAIKNLAFRCDMDAITNENGLPYHGCGHDGHSATICSLALELEKKIFHKNIFLLFQPAEETGQGGKLCQDFIIEEKIDEIYGFHNIPGYKENTILLKDDVFACASKGMTVTLHGKQSHAAYPEQGINPSYLIGEIICNMYNFINNKIYKSMVLCTIINVKVGEKSFGVSPANGEISLTLRAPYEEDLEKLQNEIESYTSKRAKESGLIYEFSYNDEFPDTINNSEIFNKVFNIVKEKNYDYQLIKNPFRWSEDFGYYLKKTKGLFIGIGIGEDWPGVHTRTYEYNDNVIPTTTKLLLDIINS